jgi:hypothetical protein
MRLSQRGGSIYEARALGPRAFSYHTSWMVEDYVLQLIRRSYYFSLCGQTEYYGEATLARVFKPAVVPWK